MVPEVRHIVDDLAGLFDGDALVLAIWRIAGELSHARWCAVEHRRCRQIDT